MSILRPAAREDLPALADILQGWICETPWMPVLHGRAATGGFLRHLFETAQITVAGSGPARGFLCRDGGEIPALYLSAAARGQGIGAALIGAAQVAAPRLGLWTFQANSGARRFYARHGFREVRLTDGARNEEKLPDVRLEWSQR